MHRPLCQRSRGRWTLATGTTVRQMSLTIVMVADVPSGGEERFQAYEAAVLPLLPRHGGRLERRFRTGDARTEVHVVTFQTQGGFDAYLADDERRSHRRLLDGLDVVQRLLVVEDVPLPAPTDG